MNENLRRILPPKFDNAYLQRKALDVLAMFEGENLTVWQVRKVLKEARELAAYYTRLDSPAIELEREQAERPDR